jgi:hypothetical protein
MNDLNKQLFQELDNEMAANLSGGVAVLYENADLSGRRVTLDNGSRNLKEDYNFDNETSAIYISPGERWAFYNYTYENDYLASLPGEKGSGTIYGLSRLKEKGISDNSITSLFRTVG